VNKKIRWGKELEIKDGNEGTFSSEIENWKINKRGR